MKKKKKNWYIIEVSPPISPKTTQEDWIEDYNKKFSYRPICQSVIIELKIFIKEAKESGLFPFQSIHAREVFGCEEIIIVENEIIAQMKQEIPQRYM